MNVLVTGCKGQLGTELQKLAISDTRHHWIFTDVDTLDICDKASVEACFTDKRIEVCINCAAYTAVDKAEDEPELATLINAFAPKVLADTCKRHNALLIHVSTDYVFGGDAHEPYKVDDPINPQSVYGSTKAEGERLIRESGCSHMIVRTAWLYSSVGKNFVKTMLMLGDTKDEINVVADQKGCPTWAHDLAVALMALLNKNGKNEVHETFHFTNEGQITWHNFATAIMEIGGKTCKVNPITTDQYPTKAKRPAYSVLDLSKIKEFAGIEIPEWRESLEKCIKSINNPYPISKDGKIGFIDTSGVVVIHPQFDMVGKFHYGFALVRINGKYGYIDRTGHIIIEPKYEGAGNFSEGLARVRLDGKYGFIDKTGSFIIEPQFYQADDFSEGLAPAKTQDNCGFIDKTGKFAFKLEYNYAMPFSGGLALVQIEGRLRFIDHTGELVINQKISGAQDFSEGLALVIIRKRFSSKYGYINHCGEFVIKPQFDDAFVFSNGLAGVKIGNKWGFTNKTGDIIINTQFDEVRPFSEGLAPVKIENKCGFINSFGQFVIEPQFDNAGPFIESLAPVWKDGYFNYIDKKGKTVWTSRETPACYDEIDGYDGHEINLSFC